jgi:opacity protein-like surface antigen
VKKYLLLAVAFVAMGSLAIAAPKKAKASEGGITPWVDKGDFIANVGIGWRGLSGGVELDLARIDIAKVIPVTFGAAARAFVDPGFLYDYLTFGVGGFGTAHFGFKEVNLPEGMGWISNLDAYIGLGLGMSSASGYETGFGFSTFDGVSYYLNDNLALGFEYGYFGHASWYYSSYYGSFCVTLKL